MWTCGLWHHAKSHVFFHGTASTCASSWLICQSANWFPSHRWQSAIWVPSQCWLLMPAQSTHAQAKHTVCLAHSEKTEDITGLLKEVIADYLFKKAITSFGNCSKSSNRQLLILEICWCKHCSSPLFTLPSFACFVLPLFVFVHGPVPSPYPNTIFSCRKSCACCSQSSSELQTTKLEHCVTHTHSHWVNHPLLGRWTHT